MNSSGSYFVGVTGGSGSGKTSICKEIIAELEKNGIKCVVLSADNWYYSLNTNFDCPEAYAWDELVQCIKALKEGKNAKHPVYDYTTHSRTGEYIDIPKAKCYFIEGILVLHDDLLLKELDLKVFVETDDDIRLIRRIRRDIQERGRDLDGILEQHLEMVKPGHDKYIQPTRKNANFIVPNSVNGINQIAIELIVQALRNKLKE